MSPYREPASVPRQPTWGVTRWKRLVVRVMRVFDPHRVYRVLRRLEREQKLRLEQAKEQARLLKAMRDHVIKVMESDIVVDDDASGGSVRLRPKSERKSVRD